MCVCVYSHTAYVSTFPQFARLEGDQVIHIIQLLVVV